MNIDDFKDIIKKVKKSQTEDRFQHTIGVAYTAATLAMKYEISIENSFLAGILHDCAKCLTDDDLLYKCNKHHIKISDFEGENPYLLHCKLGAFYARKKYKVENEEIINAILFHTTGQPNMSMIEKIIFVADYIEPNRNKAASLDEIRKIAYEDIDRAVFIIIKNTIDYLKKSNKPIDYASIETFNYYKELINC